MGKGGGKYYTKPSYATEETVKYEALPDAGQARQVVQYHGGFRDCAYAIVFWLFVAALGVVMGIYWNSSDALNNLNSNSDIDLDPHVYWGIATGGIVAVVFAAIYITILRCSPICAVYTSLGFSLLITVATGAYLLYIGQYMFGGIWLCILLPCQCCWIWCIRSRIPLAAVMLDTAASITMTYWGTLVATVFTIIVGVALLLLWFLSLYSVLIYLCNTDANFCNAADSGDSTAEGEYFGILFAYLFVILWILTVKSAVVHCTAAGAFGVWYFQVEERNPVHPNASCGAFQRATTTSFGSLCYGSLIITVITMMRILAQQMEESDNALVCFIGCCLDCILGCIQGIVEFINSYAYTIVAIYGDTYCEAVSKTMAVFQGNGFDMLINDDISETVLNFGSFGGAVLSCLASLAYLYACDASEAEYITGGVAGFLLGAGIVGILNSSIGSGVRSFYICFALDPLVLYNTKPGTYNRVLNAWAARYGGLSGAGLPCQVWMTTANAPMPDESYSMTSYGGIDAPPEYQGLPQSTQIKSGTI